MSTNSSRFLSTVVRDLILNSFELLIIRMSLVDVCLHHLVLLVDHLTGRKRNTLIALLARLTNSLEGWVLMWSNSHVGLQCIHRLRTTHHRIRSVSHLVLSSSKLRTLSELILLLGLYLEAIRRLESL